jgi:hypothetical protein
MVMGGLLLEAHRLRHLSKKLLDLYNNCLQVPTVKDMSLKTSYINLTLSGQELSSFSV